MIGHQTSINKFKKIEIISSVLSDLKGFKLATNLKEKTQKQSNSWRLDSMLLNTEWVRNKEKTDSNQRRRGRGVRGGGERWSRNIYKGHMDKAKGDRIEGGRWDGWARGSGESKMEKLYLKNNKINK